MTTENVPVASESHPADAVWLGCGDGRLHKGRDHEMERRSMRLVDIPAPPGGPLGLVSSSLDPYGQAEKELAAYEHLHQPNCLSYFQTRRGWR